MREKKRFTVISFYTTAAAMEMEKICGARGIPGRLIPLPREISAGCGIAWRMETGDWELYGQEIADSGIDIEKVNEVEQWVVSRSAAGK